jgi:hypothetical protein
MYKESADMIRTRPLTALSLLLGCLLVLPAPITLAQTEEFLTVEKSWHQVLFGKSLQFFLTATSSTDIVSAVLTYRTSDSKGMTIKRLDFSPTSHVELTLNIDPARDPLKPFVEITYRWTVSDAEGRQVITDPQQLFYDDPRFRESPSLTGQYVIVHWYSGDIAFGNRALDAADRAVDRMRETIDPTLNPSEPFHLYLYASEADLLRALPVANREWVVGQAYPESRVALAAIPPGAESAATMRWLIPHELTHLLLYEAMGSSYGRLPPWLNEGLAVASKQVPDPDDQLVLERASQSDQLLALDALCHSFPYEDDRAHLAYAQSASFVRFIQENYGHSSIRKLVAVYSEGILCQRGVRLALGTSLGSLEAQWRKSLGTHSKSAALLRQAMPWLVLVLISLPLLILVAQPLAARRRERPRERPT